MDLDQAPNAPQPHIGRRRPLVVVLVHGIRTEGAWQELVADVLRGAGAAEVVAVRFGYFDLFRFLVPTLRGAPIRRLLRELRDVRDDHPPDAADLAVLAHSFGTYAVTRLLRDNPDVRLKRLVLCGSIVPRDFRWDQIKGQLTERVLNDCGTLDIWPVLAQSLTWGYGASGTFGFGSNRARDRYHRIGHSAFFSRSFAEHYWAPFVLHGEVVPSEWDLQRPPSPWWQSALAIVPLKWIGLAAIAWGAIGNTMNALYTPREAVLSPVQWLVPFDFDKSTMSSYGRIGLDSVVRWLNAVGGRRVTVEGHASLSDWQARALSDADLSKDAYGYELAERRAKTVVEALVRLGVSRSRIDLSTKGVVQPLTESEGAAGFAINRSARIIGQH